MSLALTQLIGFGAAVPAATAAAYPTVAATNTSTNASSAGATVSLPTGIASGDLLIAFCVQADDRLTTWPAGWTELYDTDSGNMVTSVGYRVADGSEGSTISLTFPGGATTSAHITFRITNYTGTPEVGTAVGGTSTTPNPPSLTPSWGSDDTLFIALGGARTTGVASAAPTDYSNLLTSAHTTPGPSAMAARRELTASSDDPATFTIPSSVEWQAQTIAIRGA